MKFIIENWEIIVVALLAISEVLGNIKKVEANSVFQLITNLLKKIK